MQPTEYFPFSSMQEKLRWLAGAIKARKALSSASVWASFWATGGTWQRNTADSEDEDPHTNENIIINTIFYFCLQIILNPTHRTYTCNFHYSTKVLKSCAHLRYSINHSRLISQSENMWTYGLAVPSWLDTVPHTTLPP